MAKDMPEWEQAVIELEDISVDMVKDIILTNKPEWEKAVELLDISVDMGEDIILAKDMPEWEKAVELEDIICWQALLDFDSEEKIVAKRREK